MNKAPLFPRLIRPRLLEALADTPAVLIHGPRQCGKTTLAQLVGNERGYRYFTFDDATVLAAAREDPVGFVDRLPERAILDEVQRAPALFASLKRAIDQERKGRLGTATEPSGWSRRRSYTWAIRDSRAHSWVWMSHNWTRIVACWASFSKASSTES